MSRSADVVILGGGSGGYAAAIRSAELGRSVILIEENELGGTCLHQGCIPTKALLHSAEVADNARTAAQFGVDVTFGGVDLEKVLSYQNTIVTRLHKGLQGLVDSHGITVVNGRGRLVGPNGIEVDGELITGAAVVLATGSSPKTLPGISIGGRVVTSDQALVLPTVPKKAIILGGGVIGVEFASVWASFGASVTIVEAMPRLVPNEDETVSKYLERAFRRRKIAAKTGVRVTEVAQDEDAVTVTLDSGDVLDADVVLVAVGRGPNTASMGYEETGVVLDRGFVVTSDRLRTTVPNVYAVGDIVPGLQLAHRGFQQGIFVAEEIAGLRPDVIDETGIPRVTYSHPEVASVGLTETAAREKFGEDIRTVVYDLAGNGKSQILKTSGAVKLVVAPDGVVVGVHMVGDRVGELIGEAQLLYNFEVDAAQAAKFVHAHPTQGEALGEALLAVAGKPLHVHA
ncbi:dihydrolipoyl dehydrogenase [Rhodococcus pseudokoreensis]|uniref:Dihydrolipoyl dehydrogenase n=1 Tax=Rhodococcus pseudokoreensis TaxID=2811421 RepID=A0A974W732_9NOCA|nr:dihydrolipoyl dehydrogenase [Rhodococcus pseudokoreensis]QSE92415.1 dihydrolipoyl dehydrogenase [Rhodococcus pseudokoreensis]